jgi:cyanophycin synthetase
VLAAHRAAGGRVAFVRENHIVLAEGAQETVLVALTKVPLTHGGRVGFQVENCLASAAAAWALGVPVAEIRAGLESFNPGLDRVPARFNLLNVAGVTVVLDYGHNVSALAKLIEALAGFPHKWRSIIYSASGDRRDVDMVQQGEKLGNAFDRVILYEDSYLKGRKEGEIFALFGQGLAKGARVKEVVEVRGGLKAVETGLTHSHPGDLLVIQPDIIDDTVAYLRRLLGDNAREIGLDEALAPPPGDPGIEVRRGRLGQSVYTTRRFARGQTVLKTWGPRTAQRSRHSMQVDTNLHILPLPPLQFLNHSCAPNCGLIVRRGVEEIEVHALRDVEVGEEYDTIEWEVQYMPGPCLCGTTACRGAVRGYKHMPARLREEYGAYIAEYLRELETPALVPEPVVVRPAVGV